MLSPGRIGPGVAVSPPGRSRNATSIGPLKPSRRHANTVTGTRPPRGTFGFEGVTKSS